MQRMPSFRAMRFLQLRGVYPFTATTIFAAGTATFLYTSPRSLCTADASSSKPSLPTVYQYKICPFCNRVKAYLDYLNIEYNTVEVNPLTKSEISFSKDARKVPIANINGEIVADSGNIIDAITKNLESNALMGNANIITDCKKFFPPDTAKWSDWSEKTLAVMLYPNITRSLDESWECFGYSKDVESWSAINKLLVRTLGSAAMFLAVGKIKKKYGIVDERKELKEVLQEWCDAIGDKKFLHGDYVTMPDIQVFGVLRSIQGLRTFQEIMAENPALKVWYDNVNSMVHSYERKL